jgi:hypothetical protein
MCAPSRPRRLSRRCSSTALFTRRYAEFHFTATDLVSFGGGAGTGNRLLGALEKQGQTPVVDRVSTAGRVRAATIRRSPSARWREPRVSGTSRTVQGPHCAVLRLRYDERYGMRGGGCASSRGCFLWCGGDGLGAARSICSVGLCAAVSRRRGGVCPWHRRSARCRPDGTGVRRCAAPAGW